MRKEHFALAEEYAEFERMSFSADPVERALGTFYTALVPSFHYAMSDLNTSVASNHIVAASMQVLAQIVAGLMIAAHAEGAQNLYSVWQPSFDTLVKQNLALLESGHDNELPAALKLCVSHPISH